VSTFPVLSNKQARCLQLTQTFQAIQKSFLIQADGEQHEDKFCTTKYFRNTLS